MLREIPLVYREYLAARESARQSADRAGLSARAFWVGAFLSLVLAVGAPFANTAMHATFMAWDFNTPGAIFLFLVLIGLLNALFKLAARSRALADGLGLAGPLLFFAWWVSTGSFDPYRPGWIFAAFLAFSAPLNAVLARRGRGLALNRAELALVYVMLLVVSALCTMGMSQQLLPIISAFFYYASPQNRWREKLLPHLPERGVLVDDGQDNRAFFEGAGPGGVIPYGAWVEPLLWWALFLVALYAAMVSAAVILRRQWMERERLAYPITQVGLAMVAGESEKGLVNGFFRRRAVWWGLLPPLFFGSLRALHHYDPAVPGVDLLWWVPFGSGQRLQLRISFAMIGFSYLINTSISAGLWFFQLLALFEAEALLLMGLRSEQRFVYGIAETPYLAYQGGGALIALVLLGLWTGREHLGQVWRKALGRAPEVDDGDEILSYRSAVVGLAGGTGVMVWWLWLMGTPLWVALLFVVLALLIFIGITRVVAEAGLAAVRSPMIAPDLVVQGLGSSLVGAQGVFNLSLAYIWAADIRVFVLGMVANGLKLVEQMDRESRRRVKWGILLALLIGATGSCWMVLHMAYRHGGINLVGWFFKGGPQVVYDTAVRGMEPAGVAWDGMAFLGGGGAAMLAMHWARHRFLWWPLHPLGFAVAANHLMNKIWFSVLIAWTIKKAVLRYGGPAFYRRSQDFFLGLIAGEALCNGLWIVIDYFTGHTGNIVFILG